MQKQKTTTRPASWRPTRVKEGPKEFVGGLVNQRRAEELVGGPNILRRWKREGLPFIRDGGRNLYDQQTLFEFAKKRERSGPMIHESTVTGRRRP